MSSEADPAAADALRRAAVRATLAPSVRDTQPWRFVLRGSALEIHADWTRRLGVIDRDGNQLLMSCGAAVFNARVSLAAGGYEAVATRYPDRLQPDLVTRLTIGEPRSFLSPIGALDSVIEARNRNAHECTDEPLAIELIDELAISARAEGAELIALASTADQLVAARLTELADSLERADPAYRAEMRASAADDFRRRDGVYGNALRGTDSSTQVFGRSPSLLLLGSTRDTPSSWIGVGEALQRILLELGRRGYGATLSTQAVEVEQTNALLRTQLRLGIHPALLLRVGAAPATVGSRRRRLVDLISEVAN